MAGGIFGFADHPQRGSLDKRQVGQLLQQRRQEAQVEPPSMARPETARTIAESLTAGEGQLGPSAEDKHERLRAIGALLAGGTGAISDGPVTQHSDTASNLAVSEMFTRLGNGGNPGRANIVKSPGALQRLKLLGMSDVEAELLSRSGAI